MDELKCLVIEIIRGATHDGPGLRTTVFLKGCPLNCLWCQNPEGIDAGQDIWWEKRKCIRCLSCLAACRVHAIFEDRAGLRRDRQKCTLCGACVEACPSLAMSFTAQEWSIEALVKEALKDQDYHRAFGGGVTVSGGEPLGRHTFVAEFLKRLHQAGVHTALDTCGLAPAAAFAAVLPHTDLVLFDIKLFDADQHRAYTGQPNETILANLVSTAGYIREVNRAKTPGRTNRMKLWIRTPLIPDATATPENIIAISQFIVDHLLDVMERWEFCTFNSACQSKYEKLGRSWRYAGSPIMTQRAVDAMKEAALSTGLAGEKLVVSGLIA